MKVIRGTLVRRYPHKETSTAGEDLAMAAVLIYPEAVEKELGKTAQLSSFNLY